jgi:hypothetical protein
MSDHYVALNDGVEGFKIFRFHHRHGQHGRCQSGGIAGHRRSGQVFGWPATHVSMTSNLLLKATRSAR